MDFSLTKEQLLIQKMARDYAEQAIQPALSTIEKENQVPASILTGLAELDLFGLAMPEEYGGADAGYESYVLAMEQIARVSCGPAMILSAHSLGLGAINNFGSREQKDRYMPGACRGEGIASFAFTEPGTGSDPRQLTTTAVKDGNSYIINGTKRFISNASYPGPLVFFAMDSESGKPTAYIMDKQCPGYSVSEPWEKLGWHGGDLVDVYFKDVRIPAENVLGQAGDGYPILQYGIAYGKIGMNSVALGTTLAAYEEAVKYARQKTHRGDPIAKFQAIQLRVANIAMLYESSRWIAYRLGWLANKPKSFKDFAHEAALAKVVVAENAVQAARIAMDIHGSYGLMVDYNISRIYRDAIMGPQVEGVIDMQKIIVAGDILKG
ncbi:MAG TPA: acyl-CoA dehydrogenase family protein [Syntrophomonadaceae bacterium]|nr:acyl-CoA dehydrogenase family protein [Syntrophomonadaceae bacterium]